MKARYFRYKEIRSQRYPDRWESDYRSWMDVGSKTHRGQVDNENNSQSQYLNILNNIQSLGLIYESESIAIRNRL